MYLYHNIYSIAINIYRKATPKLPFQTFQQLQKLTQEKHFTLVATKYGSTLSLINSSFPKSSVVYETSSLKAMERVYHGKDMIHFGLQFEIFDIIPKFNCSLIAVGDDSFPLHSAGILYAKSAPKWLRNLPLPTIIAFRNLYKTYNSKYRPSFIDFSCNDNLTKPLKFQQIESAFYLIMIGFIAAGLAFVAELLSGKIKHLKHFQKKMKSFRRSL